MWRESCGFEAALAAISSLDAAFSPDTPDQQGKLDETGPHGGGENHPKNKKYGDRGDSIPSPEEAFLMEAEHFRVIEAALFTLVASASAGPVAVVRGEQLVGCRANRRYLRREISYDSLACCLVNSGVVARYVSSVSWALCFGPAGGEKKTSCPWSVRSTCRTPLPLPLVGGVIRVGCWRYVRNNAAGFIVIN